VRPLIFMPSYLALLSDPCLSLAYSAVKSLSRRAREELAQIAKRTVLAIPTAVG
jgi:hypothetical protein